MNRPDGDPPDPALTHLRAARLDTASSPAGASDEDVPVMVEGRLTLDVEQVDSYTLLCTPGDELPLAAGFLLSEGLIESMDDLSVLKLCEDDPRVVRARLARGIPAIGDPGRNLLITSSCGACGIDALDEKIAALPRVGEALRIEASVLRAVAAQLRGQQALFRHCGGTHAAGLFDASGRFLVCAEDAGRHNALDKAIGKSLLAGRSPAGCGVMLSSRVSLEMVAKCARAGIELVAAVSATTSLAVEVAERCGITLCAFVREDRATVFAHPSRIAL